MGHRHTSEERSGAAPLRNANHGSAPLARKPMSALLIQSQDPHSAAQHKSALLQSAVLFALRFYRLFLSAQLGGTCRFHPSCSQYAYEAAERFGALRGSWLALKRLLRCHPLSSKFGYDPVPDPFGSTGTPACAEALEQVVNAQQVRSARFLPAPSGVEGKRAPFQAATPAPERSANEAHS
jgi:uncharacterized protein